MGLRTHVLALVLALPLALGVALTGPGSAVADIPAGVPDPLSPEPLQRAALIAMPAVWQVQTTARMTGLRTKAGALITLPPRARTVNREGTAFAVTPDGYLVTATHVVQPRADDLAASAYLQYLAISGRPHDSKIAAKWVKDNAAVPSGLTPIETVVRPVAAGAAAKVNRAVAPEIVETDNLRDIAVLRVPNLRDAPALGLDRGVDSGTPIATLGFGSEDPFAEKPRGALIPAVRTGVITRTGPREDEPLRILSFITNEVERGDSGGPVIDANGRVRGVVLIKRQAGGGAMAPTDQLLRVLDRANVRGWEGRTQGLYREALARAARFDLAGARTDLRRTLASYPAHGLAAYEITRMAELEDARLALAGEPWYRGGLWAAGISALVMAAVLAALLWKAVNRSPGVLGPRNRKAPFDQDTPEDDT
jgi:S1-C subfamily serine protease